MTLRLTPEAREIHRQCRLIVGRVRKEGGLKRPEFCERCGVEDTSERHPETFLMAHHEDYTKPLEVHWLCQVCHPKADAERRERHPHEYYRIKTGRRES